MREVGGGGGGGVFAEHYGTCPLSSPQLQSIHNTQSL